MARWNDGIEPDSRHNANMNGKLGIWDGGAVRGTHVELRGRVVQEDSTSTLDDHATHVSGTMIATGINPQAKGMAFQAPLLRAWDFNNDLSEMTSAAPSLYLSNHSYGTIAGWDLDANNNWDWYGISGDTVDYQFGYYDSGAQGRDSIAYNAPYYLIVQAASNNRGGNRTSRGFALFRVQYSEPTRFDGKTAGYPEQQCVVQDHSYLRERQGHPDHWSYRAYSKWLYPTLRRAGDLFQQLGPHQ